jgi:hypothetical protein
VIVTYVSGDRSDLKPGTKIFAAVQKQSDGTLQAPRITYGKDGLTPPMCAVDKIEAAGGRRSDRTIRRDFRNGHFSNLRDWAHDVC